MLGLSSVLVYGLDEAWVSGLRTAMPHTRWVRAQTGSEAIEQFVQGGHPVCLLGYGVAAENDFALLTEFRRRDRFKPIVFITSADQDLQDLQFLVSASSDVVPISEAKPFLMARVFRNLFEKQDLLAKIRSSGIKDDLTGVDSRLFLLEFLRYTLAAADRHDFPIHLCMCGINGLNQLNSQHGYWVGNEALKHFSGILRHHLRSNDVLARYEGDLFVIVLPYLDKGPVMTCLQRVAKTLEINPLVVSRLESVKVEASYGIATHRTKSSVDDLIARASQALKQAKKMERTPITFES
ncbi:MAG: GGDEF domain-containing protein [Acidobacteria bacterium]|nr:GGDEF domain-containing protein [Acidobacteriota bacterium]